MKFEETGRMYLWCPEMALETPEYTSMSLEEVGFFHACLFYLCVYQGVPKNINERAQLFGVSPYKIRKLWPKTHKALMAGNGVFYKLPWMQYNN